MDSYADLIRAERDALRRVVEKIAALKMCEEDLEHCYTESGPYCGTHDTWITDDTIREARAALKIGA